MATVATALPEVRRAKLQRPRPGADVVARPRLAALLERALSSPLTVISGPGGCGKTTLVAHWLETAEVASGWLLLDERDAAVEEFAASLLAALWPFLADAATVPLAYLRHVGAVDPRTLGDLLADALLELTGDLVLVLDDAQLLGDGPAMRLLAALLDYPSPRLHLILLTRRQPGLPLARLRARGQLVELAAEELAFSADEARAFLRQASPGAVPEADIGQLVARTEGWAAGLRLAALALRRRPSAEVVSDLGRGRELDELADEVIDRLAPASQAVVLAATVPERVCASLCAALLDGLDEGECAALLEEALRANAYITRAGADGWYRYHQLFREVIARRRARLAGDGYERELHRRASVWFEQHGAIDDAVQHALAAGETARAGEIVERHVHPALNGDEWSAVQRWLALLPEEVVATRAGLLLARAWVAIFRAAIGQIDALVGRALALAPAGGLDDLARQGEIAGLRAISAAFHGDGRRAQLEGDRALELMPEDWQAARGVVVMRVAAALRGSGAVGAGRAAIERRLAGQGLTRDGFTLRMQTTLAVEDILSGHPGRTVSSLPATALESDASGRVIVASMARSFLGLAHSLRGELDAAGACFEQVFERRYNANLYFVIDSALGLVLVRALGGERLAALRALDALESFMDDIGIRVYQAETASLRARVALLAGETGEALRWLERAQIVPQPARILDIERVGLTAARVRLARGLPEDLALARATLLELLGRAERGRNVPLLLEAGVPLALVHARLGADREAHGLLERLAPLAEQGGIVRPFLEAGEPIVELLREQRAGSASPHAIDRLLAACGARAGQPARPPAGRAARAGDDALAERVSAAGLTEREVDVLQGLVDRLMNKEIAARLGISAETVKYHAANIYLKLGVGSRREAAARGVELGLVVTRVAG